MFHTLFVNFGLTIEIYLSSKPQWTVLGIFLVMYKLFTIQVHSQIEWIIQVSQYKWSYTCTFWCSTCSRMAFPLTLQCGILSGAARKEWLFTESFYIPHNQIYRSISTRNQILIKWDRHDRLCCSFLESLYKVSPVMVKTLVIFLK